MTKFEEKAERCRALGEAYEAVKERMNWISEKDEKGEFIKPIENSYEVQFKTFSEVLKMIEKML